MAARDARHASDTQSVKSMTSMLTMDRERLRDKARAVQMKENMRLVLCARLQQTFRKPPKQADALASEVLRVQQQRGLPAVLSDEQLGALIAEIAARWQEDKQQHASQGQSSPSPSPSPQGLPIGAAGSGRRSTSTSAREHARGSGRSSGRNANAASKQRGKSSLGSGRDAKGRAAASDAIDLDDPATSPYVTQTQLQQSSTGFRLPPKCSPKRDKESSIWVDIVKYQSVEEQLDAQRKRQAQEQQRAVLAAELARQVQQREQQHAQEREAARHFHTQALQQLQQQDASEWQKERERQQQAQQLHAIQDEQRRAKAQQHEREQQLKRQQEERVARTLQQQALDEKQREKQRKEAEQQRMRQMLVENQAEIRLKQEQKQKERVRELEVAAEYIKMEEAKDLQRRQQLDEMADRVKARMKIFGDTTLAAEDARAKEEEQRVRKYQQEREQELVEKELAKERAAKLQQQQQLVFLEQQMREKQERERAMHRELNSQAELWKDERVDADRREKATCQQRAAREQSYQQALLQQIREKETRSLEADQSSLELQLNAKLLDTIHRRTDHGVSVASATHDRSRQLQQREDSFLHTRHTK